MELLFNDLNIILKCCLQIGFANATPFTMGTFSSANMIVETETINSLNITPLLDSVSVPFLSVGQGIYNSLKVLL